MQRSNSVKPFQADLLGPGQSPQSGNQVTLGQAGNSPGFVPVGPVRVGGDRTHGSPVCNPLHPSHHCGGPPCLHPLAPMCSCARLTSCQTQGQQGEDPHQGPHGALGCGVRPEEVEGAVRELTLETHPTIIQPELSTHQPLSTSNPEIPNAQVGVLGGGGYVLPTLTCPPLPPPLTPSGPSWPCSLLTPPPLPSPLSVRSQPASPSLTIPTDFHLSLQLS